MIRLTRSEAVAAIDGGGKPRVGWVAGLLGLTLFTAQMGRAEDVALVICDVAQFSCPEGDIVGASLAQLIPNNLLGPNRYIVQNVNYADPGGLATFNGTFVTADAGGKFIYAWGTGTATGNAGMAGLYLDVSIRQRYVTVPGLWGFSEMLNANCDANAQAAASSIGFQGQVNGANLPVLGTPGDCAGGGGAVVASAGPFSKTVGGITTMIAGAQFLFAAGGFPQQITLPFGDDFPDPSINFNDPNNPLNFITNTEIPTGFTKDANVPEPRYLAVMGVGICVMALLRIRRRLSGRQTA